MTLLKTTFWMGILVCAKILSVFITSKIIAVYTGPIGLAVVEQFQNIIQIIRTFSANLIQKGVVKYVSEYKNNIDEKSKILSSGLIFSVFTSILIGLFLISFSSQISQIILQSIAFQKIIILLAISLVLFALNSLFLSILNGELEIKKYVSVNLVNTILFVLSTVILVTYFGLYGALLSLIINQSLVLFFTFYLITTCKWFRWKDLLRGIDSKSLAKLINYAFIMIIITLAIPAAQLIIRNYVAHTLSWQETGYWQGITKLSTNYAILIDTLFATYYLPKLSSAHSSIELIAEIKNYYKFLLPISVLSAIIIFILKSEITIMMFSKDFIPMIALFKYQLFGDIAKIASWILSYIMIAKTMLKELLITECLFFVCYTLSSCIGIHYFGLAGSAVGYSIGYIFYFVISIYFIYYYLELENSKDCNVQLKNYADNLI